MKKLSLFMNWFNGVCAPVYFHHTEPDKPCPLMGDIRTEHFTRLTKEEWEARVASWE